MKGSYFGVSLVVVVLALTCVAGMVFSQIGAPPPEAKPKLDHIIAPAEAASPTQLPNFVRIARGDDESQKAVATALSDQAAPEGRTAYFASVLNDPQFRLSRWCLEVLDVTDSDGKKLVKVRATPQVIGRVSTTVVGALDETYELEGGSLKLLKTEVPPSSAGVGVITD